MREKLFLIALFVLSIYQMSAQTTDDVTIVVSADGTTKEEATKIALRSAIEQAYGTFISANTAILNDSLMFDEITSISQGTIKSYDVLFDNTLPNGHVFVSLRAVVSVSSLTNYAQSKGASVEYAGATFAMNFKIEELNRQNEEKAFKDLFSVMANLFNNGFDYKISVENPKANGATIANVEIIPNANATKAFELFNHTLEEISLKPETIEYYKETERDIYTIGCTDDIEPFFSTLEYETFGYSFRSEKTLEMCHEFFNMTYPRAMLNFIIDNGVKQSQMDIIYSGARGSDPTSKGNYKEYSITKPQTSGRQGLKSIDELRRNSPLEMIVYWIPYTHVSSSIFLSSYSCIRELYADKAKLGYIEKVIDGYSPCFFGYDSDTKNHSGYVVNFTTSESQSIRIKMVIPIDDIMKTTKFTISNGKD